ncbi:GNAT family N-acyltransferase [Cognatishimia sp. F0-27]|uniref:GNAT family N-acetyltransferase n=1 Tax=Cognatishimia sp. F0-27 TaxID=2816855 RepID=UPI001D0C095E
MRPTDTGITVRLAQSADEIVAAQRLRYDVFVRELGGDGPLVDHAAGLERDAFDPHVDHLLAIDRNTDAVVGVYRLLTDQGARDAGRFYSESEFDLSPLRASGRRLLELGRSCLHKDYRGGMALLALWQGVARYVQAREIELLFGVASFHGTALAAIREPLSLLHHRHLAPEPLRVVSRDQPALDILPEDRIDRRRAMLGVPPLIKAYLRLGGFVGQGVYVDHAFNTIDVCLIVDTARLSEQQKTHLARERV